MEFTTYIIKRNTDKTVVSGNTIVLVLIIAALITGVIGFVKTATVLFILGVAAGIILFVIKKGNTQAYVLSKENKLVINSTSIELEGVVYDIEKIKDLKFVIHSYAGLRYSEGKSRIYQTSDGTLNYLTFTADGKETGCRYYLNSEKHTFILCQVLQEFYYKKVPFIETDRDGNQTYLLKRLDEKELAAFKTKYGY
ncbi:hypothetical protein A4H97_04450 [Niastella yeongjuensis]|uniref:Uncharacterized protein n=1 Tax=Niastella yeongjuensis TaxID=354355 RepID=A0A1V9EY48_9BACT|nr:hypothetical protein [Niastella yeongjuensis]OQP51070.1 hypothetical protein A4H97_04450 [Niastella yeongjuensis]SEN04167.1 hypothetical protein SAMN05660816_00044 [Niastella yeongjuensis]